MLDTDSKVAVDLLLVQRGLKRLLVRYGQYWWCVGTREDLRRVVGSRGRRHWWWHHGRCVCNYGDRVVREGRADADRVVDGRRLIQGVRWQ